MLELKWNCLHFDELSSAQLYNILKLRTEVFVVEQDCIYQDMDDNDQCASHVMGYQEDLLICYSRLLPPGTKYKEPSMGRIICALQARQQGLGKELVERSLKYCNEFWSGQKVQISAQQRLENFYSQLGFETVSEPYIEDGIPHLGMLYSPN